jgi:hypothetical protein
MGNYFLSVLSRRRNLEKIIKMGNQWKKTETPEAFPKIQFLGKLP